MTLPMKLSALLICVLGCSGASAHLRLGQLPLSDQETQHLVGGQDLSSVGAMVENLANQGAKEGVTPGLETFIKQIESMVNNDMKPKVLASHNDAQTMLDALGNAFTLCGNQKQQFDQDIGTATTARNDRSKSHKDCRQQEAALWAPKKGCDDSLASLKESRDITCGNPLFTDPPDGGACALSPNEKMGSYLSREAGYFVEKDIEMKLLRQKCNNQTKEVNDKIPVCEAHTAAYDAKKPLCIIEQTNLETAACSQAETTKSTCETYTTCYQNAVKAHDGAVPGIRAQMTDRKGEWRALMRIECLFGVFSDGMGRGVDAKQIDTCKAVTHDTSHLELNFPELPGPQACVIGASEPCLGEYVLEEYMSLPVDAPTKECTPCSWNTQTTTTTTTTTTTQEMCPPLGGLTTYEWISTIDGNMAAGKEWYLTLPESWWHGTSADFAKNKISTLCQETCPPLGGLTTQEWVSTIDGNIAAGKEWYAILPGKWWYGLSGAEAKIKISTLCQGGTTGSTEPWLAILRYGTEAYTPTSSAVGDVESTVGFAKLSDAAINAISDGSGYQHYKLTSGTDASVIYVRTQKSFSDSSRAFGWGGSFDVCNTEDFGSCSWKAVGMTRFDTEGVFGNTCDRWFADYSSNIHCYATGSKQQRCFARGSPCGHDMRTNVVMYKFGQ